MSEVGKVIRSKSLTELRDEAHKNAVDHGFHNVPITVGDSIALMHSELSEALEDHRKGLFPHEFMYKNLDGGIVPDKRFAVENAKPIGIPSEMADVIIRVLDFCGKHNIDIERAVAEKMTYNATRPFMHGGKKL